MDDKLDNVVQAGTIPTYHWSEIASPRYKDLNVALLTNSVTITQSVHKRNQTPKSTKAHPAFVIYDVAFVRYKMLELISPFLCGYVEDNYSTCQASLDSDTVVCALIDDLSGQLISELLATISRAIPVHISAMKACDDMGVQLDFEASTLIRSFKLAVERKYKTAQLESTAVAS